VLDGNSRHFVKIEKTRFTHQFRMRRVFLFVDGMFRIHVNRLYAVAHGDEYRHPVRHLCNAFPVFYIQSLR
jgi:hypothetical protein